MDELTIGSAAAYYLRIIQISWAHLNKRERKHLMRKYPLIAISLRHLVEEQMIP